MPIVVATFDTTTKKLSLSLDGVEIVNPSCVEFDRSWERPGEYSCRVSTNDEDRTGGLSIRTTLTASAEASSESDDSPAGLPSAALRAEIAAFLKQKG